PPRRSRFRCAPHPSATRRHRKQASYPLPFDLHVLGLPPAFTLSQDQTLHLKTACLAAKVFSFAEREPSARITCCKQLTCCCSTSARWTVILPAGVRTSYLRTLSKNP